MDRKMMFFNLINETLANEGFKYIKSKNSFVKKESGNEFIFAFDIWENFYMVESKLNILIGEIENIKQKAWGTGYDKFVTLGRVKSYLISDPSKGIVLTDSEENVKKAAQGEIDFYYSFAKKFFVENLNYDYLDKKLNTSPGNELYLAHNPIHTSFLAIIVAKLVNNKEIESLFNFYREIILKFNNAFIEDFDLLVAYLTKK